MPKSLADGHSKLTFCTDKPADPGNPTAAELNAGIDASEAILASDFNWSATDSDKVNEKALADTSNANALSASNFQAGVTAFRMFDADTGAVDETEDEVFQALKVKGTELWGYLRETGKLASAAWATGDEIVLGLHVVTDNPQRPSNAGGYIKRRVPMEPQEGWPEIEVVAGT